MQALKRIGRSRLFTNMKELSIDYLVFINNILLIFRYLYFFRKLRKFIETLFVNKKAQGNQICFQGPVPKAYYQF